MSKILLYLGVISTILCMGCEAAAQGDVGLVTRAAELQALSQRLQVRDEHDRRQAQEYANRLGIPVRRELPNGGVLELQRFVPGRGPVFYITYNLDAADTVSTDDVRPGGSAGLDLDGAGMVVGEWDGGAVYAGHPDFTGRLTQFDNPPEVSGHSTHVAGTLIGAGDWLEPRSRGMAYAAHLDAYDWNSDTAEMASAAAGGLVISNHSYGIAVGWLYIGGPPPDNWWWIGGDQPGDVEDPNFGYYDTESQLWDQIAIDAPYYLIVKAAGNDRSDIGPPPGEAYWVIDQDGNFLFTSTLPRDPDCAPAGYDCLPTNSVAKNVLTVGAVDDIPGGYSPLAGPSQVQMAPFSSWGPSDDGRIKPDLVGNGVFLISAWPDAPYYAAAAGTSMAAPNVTGSLLLLQEHYQDIHGPGNFMRSATLKALAIHTADEAGSANGPDYEHGWGLLNTRAAAAVITEDGGDHQIIEGSLADGATDTVQISVTQQDSILTATLVWMDPPGTPPAPTLDPPDLMLVNDLDLRIIKGPATHLPWVLDPAIPAAAATTGDNFRDNVEQVEVIGGGTGTFTVEVSHEGTLLNGANQDYALVISITTAPPTGGGLLIDEDFSGGLPVGWSVVTNQGGIPWIIASPVPGDDRLDNLTTGSGKFALVENQYAYTTETSLRTPLLDLSANNAAVLRFLEFSNYDTFETFNVDVSTNGGASWSNVWQRMGYKFIPGQIVLDLSSAIAGQPNAMIRFRFDSEGWISGDIWQVDNVELEVFGGGSLPGPAGNPSPADGAGAVDVNADLGWSAGTDATSHDVYFGTNPSPGASELQGNQAGTGFDPGTLAFDTTYHWRIDEVNGTGTTTGAVWSFSTAGLPAIVHLANLAGVSEPAPRGRWNAVVTITVKDAGGAPVSGVLAEGDWGNGTNGSGSCTTNGSGQCTAQKNNLKGNVASVDFTVTNLTAAGFGYDSGANEVPDTVTVFKDDPNLLPGAVDDSFATPVDTPLNGNVLANDDQGDAPAAVTAHDATSAAGYAVSVAANGDFTYTPSGGFNGPDSFGYTITDNNGDSSSATVDVTVGTPNLLPGAVDDSFATPVDTPLNGNVLANDDQGDAPAAVTAHDATSATGYAVSVAANGDFTYTPSGGFDGPDSFGYTITDNNGDSDSATVNVTVGNPPANRSVTTSKFKEKGDNMVLVSWSNFQDDDVSIRRNVTVLGTVPNTDGSYTDNLGKKPSGEFVYEVCEAGQSTGCATGDPVNY